MKYVSKLLDENLNIEPQTEAYKTVAGPQECCAQNVENVSVRIANCAEDECKRETEKQCRNPKTQPNS